MKMMNRQPVATASNYYHSHATNFHQHPQQYHDPVASLVYRPLQLPLQHPHEATSASPDHQQTQLSLAAYQQHQQQHQRQQQQVQQVQLQQSEFNFRHPHGQIIHQQTQHHQLEGGQHRARADSRQLSRAMAYQSDEDMANMQELSNKYEPEVTGPLVGLRQPSTAITTEYASADPIYQAKTAALPQKYSHYRTVRGDGRCGWRAVAFGYFEALIQYGDVNKLGLEQARVRSLNNVMNQAGFPPDLVGDFADETLLLLREIASAVGEGRDAASIQLETFNDETIQNCIITHLRTLTAAWMKTHEADYAPWLTDRTVTEYCDSVVMPYGAEIDNVGLAALKDVLLSPAGIALEVLYLDRSEGSEVTMHRFDGNGFAIGSVRLLYRPGHYDILYKLEDLPVPIPQIAVPTYLQFASQPNEPVYDLGVSDFMTMMPGMSYANSAHWGMSSSYGATQDFFNPSPQSSSQTMPTPSAPAPQPHMHSQPAYVAASTPTQMVPPPTQLLHDLPIRNHSHVSHSSHASHASLAHSDYQHTPTFNTGSGPFRPSVWQMQMEPELMHASHLPFKTAIFRNSHYNPAHFLNPEFQPEQWDPAGDYLTASGSSKSSRHKNDG